MPNESDRVRIDKYQLYVEAFQHPTLQMRLLSIVFEKQFGAKACILREDFCGTAANCCEWVAMNFGYKAVGIDIEQEPLDYCRTNILDSLTANQRERVSLIRADILDVGLQKADVAIALNCSFCYFKKRGAFRHYLKKCFDAFNDRGMMALELYCGADAQNLGCDEIPIEGGVAIWEQIAFDPVTNHCLNQIHFRTNDGEFTNAAFEYDWRLWSPAECVDLLREVGFSHTKTMLNDGSPADATTASDASPTLFILGFKNL